MKFRRLMAASMAGIMAVSSAIVCQISASAASIETAPTGKETVLSTVDLSGSTVSFTTAWQNGNWVQTSALDSDILTKDNVYVKATFSGLGSVDTDTGPAQWSEMLNWGFSNYNWAGVLRWYNNNTDKATGDPLPENFDVKFTPAVGSTAEKAVSYIPISDFKLTTWGAIAGNLQSSHTAGFKVESIEVVQIDETIPVSNITLDKTTAELKPEETVTLTATVAPADATDKTVTWTSSDEKVATVKDGVVTAVAAGTATITAKTSNEKTATCTVTVTDKVVAATAVTVDPTTAELEVGSTVTITGKVTPDDSTDKITWKSSDTAVATVDETGKVTAVKEGTATITATAGKKSAECTVTVKAAPEKLEGAFEYAYDGSPIELTVGEATWNDSGLAAQKNASLEMKGVTFKTTTFGELKKLYSGIVINNLEIKNVPEGIKADEISVCIYIKSGSGWSWNSFNGTSVNFADITKISDSDAIMEVGYQLNYDIPAGTSYKTGDTITINAKEEVVDPNAEIISPSTKVQQVDVKTDKNGNVTEQIAYFAISEEDAKTCESYIVTIGRGKDNKKLVREIKNCFKTVQYKAADGSDKTVVAADGAYCVLLDITNIGSDYGTLTIKIEPKK